MAIIKVLFRHQEKEVEVPEGTNLLQVVALAGVPLEGDCGGKGTCGKCKVRVLSGNILETTMAERKFLFPDELAAGWVLACQHEVIGDTVVETRVHSDDYQSKNVMKWQGSKVKVEPCVEKFFLSMELPTLDDHTPDLERLIYCLPQRNDIKISRNILSTLPRLLREAGFQVTAVLVGDRIVAVERGNTSGRVYGIALDIGTTTLAGYLVDLARGEVLSVSVSSNPQSVYGADVITRIYHAAYNKDGLKQLQDIVLGAVNGIISSLLKEAGVKKEEIYEMVVVGNTAMSHLFLGIDPANLAFSPFIPAFKCAVELQSSELGLQLLPESRVLLLPNISGFVGSDTVGAMLAARIDQRKGTCLLVDIGTNAEVVLASQGRILICSSAAGPAFEGSNISCGMAGIKGAISHYRFDRKGHREYTTIGKGDPRGICGSGLVDIIAELLKKGMIDKTGAFTGKQKSFLVLPAKETASGQDILLTQKDIREFQLAVGAIRAGISILMKEASITFDGIEVVYLAGGFGNFIDTESACLTGIIPLQLKDKVIKIGNGAGSGAKLYLLNQEARKRAEMIKKKAVYIELSGRNDFQEEFIKSLEFPPLSNCL